MLPLFIRILVLGLAVMACGAAGCRSDSATPLRVGVVVPLEGPAGFGGREMRNGLLLAQDQINARGGVNGRPMEVIIQPGGPDPFSAVQAYEALEAYQPLLTLSCLSSVGMALAPVAEERGQILVALVATAQEITAGREWVFRFWPTAGMETPPMARALEDMHVGRLGVLFLEDDYGRSVRRSLEEWARGADVRVTGAAFPVIQQDFSLLADKMLDTDAVALIGFDMHIIAAAKALRQAGYKGRMLSTTAGALPSVQGVPEAAGMWVAAPAFSNPNFSFADDLKRDYFRRFGTVLTHYAASGYEFLRLLAGLMEDRPLTRGELRSQFDQGFVHSGVFGNLVLRAGAKDIDFPLFLARIEGGRLRYK